MRRKVHFQHPTFAPTPHKLCADYENRGDGRRQRRPAITTDANSVTCERCQATLARDPSRAPTRPETPVREIAPLTDDDERARGVPSALRGPDRNFRAIASLTRTAEGTQ